MKFFSNFKNTKTYEILKKVLTFIGTKLRSFDKLVCSAVPSFIFITVFSFVINIFLEAALRKSFIQAFELIFTSPIVFLLNMLIVLASYSAMYLFRKRTFTFSIVTILWIVIISVSYYMMCKRTTPFTSSDLRVIRTTFEIIPLYLTKFQIGLLIFGILAAIALLVLIYIKCMKAAEMFSLASFFPIQVWSITIISVVLYTNLALATDRFDNLPNKYREHGFAYCFLYSIVDNGIDKPKNYSRDAYKDIKNSVETPVVTTPVSTEIKKDTSDGSLLNSIYDLVIENYNALPEYLCYNFSEEQAFEVTERLENKFGELVEVSASSGGNVSIDSPQANPNSEVFDQPNIIFLQLESFYDVTNIEGYEYSEHPHPIYSLLKEQLPGGKLSVPSIGAGTANTEFETISGMDVSLFGIAEYPYLSVLQTQTCESMAYNAKAYGYTSHAIHNHKGTFYDRNKVFPNLGFDTFTSLENMPEIVRNQRKWGKDSMLIDPILKSLDSTFGKDLIYAISVQPHGRYPSESRYKKHLMGQDPKVEVTGNTSNPENASFTYYVNQLNEVDTFLGNLILELSFINEPTVLVFYGDHLPAFSVQKYWTLKEGDCYQTDYIIWNNCGYDFSDAKDLSTYQLASYIFSKVGIDVGEANLLNRKYFGAETPEELEEYKNARHTLQYAVFMDKSLKNDSSDIKTPAYEKTEIKYGITPTMLDGIYTIDGDTYITGSNFNEFTKVTINGNTVNTEVLDMETLIIQSHPVIGDEIGTYQVATNLAVLGHSANTIVYSEDMIIDPAMYDETLDMILPIIEEDNAEDMLYISTEDDATAEFVTGQEDMDMRQDNING